MFFSFNDNLGEVGEDKKGKASPFGALLLEDSQRSWERRKEKWGRGGQRRRDMSLEEKLLLPSGHGSENKSCWQNLLTSGTPLCQTRGWQWAGTDIVEKRKQITDIIKNKNSTWCSASNGATGQLVWLCFTSCFLFLVETFDRQHRKKVEKDFVHYPCFETIVFKPISVDHLFKSAITTFREGNIEWKVYVNKVKNTQNIAKRLSMMCSMAKIY